MDKMNQGYILSTLLHFIIFSTIVISTHNSFKPTPKIEVYKVTLAPLPQVAVQSAPEPVIAEDIKPEPLKKEEKSPPTKKKQKSPDKPKVKGKKKAQGLPDIKPIISTGSGKGFTYSYYLNILLTKIHQNWHNPFKDSDIILKTVIYFEVDKKGTIYGIRIEENSGNEVYNESAMRAVAATRKLPPLPQEFVNDYLKVHLEFLTAN